MTARLNLYTVAPAALEPMLAMEKAVMSSGLEHGLLHLIKMRASQINGCGYCLHMHSREARADGEREERLHVLAGWWESSYFTEREQAALAWTEALTLVAESRAPDAIWERLKGSFTDEEIVKLTLAITTINAWNRMAVGFRNAHPKGWTIDTAKAA